MLAIQAEAPREEPAVLLVEDEVLIRLMIAEELRSQGFHVIEASNAEEALAILESSVPVHLLFTDLRMPGRMNGIELGRLARARFPRLKLMMTSANSPDTDIDDIADAFLPKPYELLKVVEQVGKLLAHPGDGG
jgi:CheY-like chemotaxis protein